MVETVKHSTMKTADMHSLVRWDVVDAAALPAAPVAADLHKLAYVQATGEYFVLQAITPEIVWKEFSYEGNNPIVDVGVLGLDITFTYEDGATVVVSIPENPAIPDAVVDVSLTGQDVTFTYASTATQTITLPSYTVYTGNAVENITYSDVDEAFTVTFRDTTTATIPFAAGGGAGATVGQVSLFLTGADTTNWLGMDGSSYARTAYPALAALFPAVTLDNVLVQVWDDNNTLAGAPLQYSRIDAMVGGIGADEVLVSYSAGSSSTRIIDSAGVARTIGDLAGVAIGHAKWDPVNERLYMGLQFGVTAAISYMTKGGTTFTEQFQYAGLVADLDQVIVMGFAQGMMVLRYKVSTSGSWKWGYLDYLGVGPSIVEITALGGWEGVGTTWPITISNEEVWVMNLNGTGVVSKVDILANIVTDVVTTSNGYDYSIGVSDNYIVKENFGATAAFFEIYDKTTGALLRSTPEFAGAFYNAGHEIPCVKDFAFAIGFAQNGAAPYDWIAISNMAVGTLEGTPTNNLGNTVESIFIAPTADLVFIFCSNNTPDGTTGYGQLYSLGLNEDANFTLANLTPPDASTGYFVYAGE